MTVAKAAELIAPFVDLCWPKDKVKLLSILDIVNSRAWKEGKFWGMTREFHVRVSEKDTIITPPGYNVMLKANIDGDPVDLRDTYFQFHKNGNGSVNECCGKNWTGGVIDLGESPVVTQPYQRNSCKCTGCETDCFQLGVVATNCGEDEYITIKGYYPHDSKPLRKGGTWDFRKRIYSYISSEDSKEVVKCCTKEEASQNKWEVQDGVKIKLTQELQIMDLFWGHIESIEKTITNSPVEVFAINTSSKESDLIARLEPWETESIYRKYQVPNECILGQEQHQCVHGLFKISEPKEIVSDQETLVVDDREALIALAKGVNMMYFKDDDVNGERYVLRGIKALDNQLREQRSNAETPIQVDGPEVIAGQEAIELMNY